MTRADIRSRFTEIPGNRSDTREIRRITGTNQLWGSNGVAFGPDGRLYVAQFLGGQISAVDLTGGEVEVIVPMGGPVQSPDDLAFGADGSMYITDLIPGKVWRRTSAGDYSLVSEETAVPNGITCVGNRLFVNEMRPGGRLLELFPDGDDPVELTGGLAMGNAMQLGPDGYLYYPHMLTGQVHRIHPDGGAPELVAERVHEPVAVRFDKAGALVVLSRGSAGIVTRIDLREGTREMAISGIPGLDNAAFDEENRMYVSSFASGGITELDLDGQTRTIVPRGLDGPFGLTVDASGAVCAADHYRLATPEDDGSVLTSEMLIFSHGIVADGEVLHVSSQYGEVRTYDPATRDIRVRAKGLDLPMGVAVLADRVLAVAEAGTGRVLGIDAADTVRVLADGLGRPVDVAVSTEGCYISDEERGTIVRITSDGATESIVDGLVLPQGIAVHAGELFIVEIGLRRLLVVDLATGAVRVEAEELAVGTPPGVDRVQPARTCHGMPGAPRPFAGVAVAPDGTVHVSADGEGSVLSLPPS